MQAVAPSAETTSPAAQTPARPRPQSPTMLPQAQAPGCATTPRPPPNDGSPQADGQLPTRRHRTKPPAPAPQPPAKVGSPPPAHDWARHHCPRGHIGHYSRCRLHSRGYRSQPRNGLMLKHRPRRDHQTRLARAAHQLDRDDAVASEREEIVLDPNSLDTQNLRKQTAQNLLTRRARRAKTEPTNRRRRQCSAVKLPVRRQWKMIKLHYRRRHQVVRKPRTNLRAQLPSINRTPSRRYHIAH